ncbi:hypothetical protein [Virgibacillus pantothenticus]|nr:hypothetical protein [Virgibacillus pantothenticus]
MNSRPTSLFVAQAIKGNLQAFKIIHHIGTVQKKDTGTPHTS